MNRKGLEGYGPYTGKWDEVRLGCLVGVDELDRRVCFHAVQLCDSMTMTADESRVLDVVYTDFNKAFDKIPHGRLIKKVKAHVFQ
eukprot:g29615.t1